jgi:hypothetical protein
MNIAKIATVIPVLALAASLAACGGGGGTTVLHGTYAYTSEFLQAGQSCQAQAQDGGNTTATVVDIAVDSIPAASAVLNWQGSAQVNGGTTAGCTGTWSATVKTASVAYQLTMPGDEDFTITYGSADVVSPADAARSITING